MRILDLNRIRELSPNRLEIKLVLYKDKNLALSCYARTNSLSEDEEKIVMDWQEEVIGKENIYEFYLNSTGRDWVVYLKGEPKEWEFIGIEDGDYNPMKK